MIAEALALSLVTVAFAHPPYVESDELIKDAKQQISELLPSEKHIPDLRSPSRHYAVLLSQIGQVAGKKADNCSIDYETVYMDSLADNIAIALIDVDSVKEITKLINVTVNNSTQVIQDLMKDLCNKTMPNEVCNELMDKAVKGDPKKYQHGADVFLAAGDAANYFLNQPLPSVAENYEEMVFLLENITQLSFLINAHADLLRRLVNEDPCH